jgi:hypothetical protein
MTTGRPDLMAASAWMPPATMSLDDSIRTSTASHSARIRPSSQTAIVDCLMASAAAADDSTIRYGRFRNCAHATARPGSMSASPTQEIPAVSSAWNASPLPVEPTPTIATRTGLPLRNFPW